MLSPESVDKPRREQAQDRAEVKKRPVAPSRKEKAAEERAHEEPSLCHHDGQVDIETTKPGGEKHRK